MPHHHSPAHFHVHDEHDVSAQRRRLAIALGLTTLFLVVEVVGGIVANSLALLADAGHMFTDAAALGLALFVHWFSRQPATPEKTYGYLRWEVLAAFLNGSVLLLVSAGIVWEAIGRFRSPEPVADSLMLVVAVVGLIVNLICAALLHHGHQHSMNVRGAYLHVLGDLLGSVGTIAAALVIRWTGWLVADPLASILVTLLIIRSAWSLVRESVDVLLESTPSHISIGAVRDRLERLGGVEAVHDLHVWTVTSGMIAMSAHAVVPDPARHPDFLAEAQAAMQEFGIGHVTLQIEQRQMCQGMHA